MGWNTWDCYGAAITESEFRACADVLAERLLPSGWQYAVVDIQWYDTDPAENFYPETESIVLDEYGRVVPAPNRFPSADGGKGFGPLADYTHSKGLKFGLHIMQGIPRRAVRDNLPILGTDVRAADIADTSYDCSWCKNNWNVDVSKPGAQEYYDSLIALFAEWGVDYIKVDDLSRPYNAATIEALRSAIDRCGRRIVLSLSPGPAPLDQAEHVKRHAELWRASHDLWDTWGEDDGWAGLHAAFELAAAWAPHGGPGHWPDLDMLPLGRISMRGQRGPDRQSKLTPDEQRTMMTLWCIARSPLMWGGDPLSLDDATLSLLTNEEVLAVLNGSSGNSQLSRTEDSVVWVADAGDGGKYVALFNVGDGGTVKIAVELAALGLNGPCRVRDMWAREDLPAAEGALAASVPEHGAALFRVAPAA
jgi:hypothetical protein